MKKKGEPIRRERSGRMRRIREQLGMTQDEFAEWIGVSAKAYKSAESGVNNISQDLQDKLYARGISPEFIMYGKRGVVDEAWRAVHKCSDIDKLQIFCRLVSDFCRDESRMPDGIDFGILLRALQEGEVQEKRRKRG